MYILILSSLILIGGCYLRFMFISNLLEKYTRIFGVQLLLLKTDKQVFFDRITISILVS